MATAPLHDAKQHGKPIPKVRGRGHVAGEFRRRSDRHVVGSPFGTNILPDFPSRVHDGGYFLLRQKCRDAFLQIALKVLLNLLRISRQRQWSFISQPARFIRGPVAVEYGDLGLTDFRS